MMEQDLLTAALKRLPELLASFDRQIGSYTGHVSSSKGVTLKTQRGHLYLYPRFIYKLIHNPDSFTEDELTSVFQHAAITG